MRSDRRHHSTAYVNVELDPGVNKLFPIDFSQNIVT